MCMRHRSIGEEKRPRYWGMVISIPLGRNFKFSLSLSLQTRKNHREIVCDAEERVGERESPTEIRVNVELEFYLVDWDTK